MFLITCEQINKNASANTISKIGVNSVYTIVEIGFQLIKSGLSAIDM